MTILVNSHIYWALAQAYMSFLFILLSQILGRYSHKHWAEPYFSSYILGQTVLFSPIFKTVSLERDCKLSLLRTNVLHRELAASPSLLSLDHLLKYLAP